MIRPAAAACAAAILLASCSGAAANPPATRTAAFNATVCRHYLAQRRWVLGLTQPTLGNAAKFALDVAVDAAQSTGQLHQDLTAMSAAQQAGRSPFAASKRVFSDCTTH